MNKDNKSNESLDQVQVLARDCPLQQQENFTVGVLLQVLNVTEDPIFVKDRQHRWVLVNDAFASFMGCSSSELIGKSAEDFFAPHQAKMLREQDELVFTTGITHENEQSFIDAQGVTRLISTKKCLLEYGEGNKFVVGTIRDLTQKKLPEAKDIINYQLTEQALRKSEAKLQKLSANIPGVLYQYMLSPDGSVCFPYINSRSIELYGLTPEEIQNDASLLVSIVHPDDRQQFEQSIAISAQTLQPWEWEGRIVLADGQVKWVQGISRPELQVDGAIIWDGIITDVSHRKQIEAALQQAYTELETRVAERTKELQTEIAERRQKEAELKTSEQRLALLIQQTPIGIVVWDTKFEIQEWNPAAEKIFGYSRSEVIGRHFGFLVPEIVREYVDQAMDALLHLQGETVSINQNVTKDHRIITCEWYNNPLVVDNGEVISIASMVLDITERQQAEQSLMLYKQAVESSSDAIAIADADGNHIYQNPAFCQLYECPTVEDFIKFGGAVAAFTDAAIGKEIWQATVSGKSWVGEVEQKSTSGWIIQTFLRSYPLKDSTGKNIGLVGTITDITERKRAEAQLREQEQFLRTVFDGSEHLIFTLDVLEDGNLIYSGWNPASERGTGLSSSEAIGRTPKELFGAVQGADVHQKYLKCLAAGTTITYEECLHLRGEETWWLTTLNPLLDSGSKIYRLVGTAIEITDRKRTEIQLQQQTKNLETALQELQETQMQLVQSEKMSSLGQLVAGVAHEINNPVNFIYGNLSHANDYAQDLLQLVQLYQQYCPDSIQPIQEFTETIDLEFLIQDLPQVLNSMKVGAQRIREIVISLRTFSRMDEAEMKEVDIHEGIDSTLMILEHRIKAKSDRGGIKVIKEYSNLPLVECYAGQLNQVFMNILANAIDALEESMSSGKITDSAQICIRTQQLEPNQVTICIADNGPGISEEVKKRLFDPFFTTKPIGKGTGMGLSISYQIIVQKHSGTLECISKLGGGTEFLINIPLKQG